MIKKPTKFSTMAHDLWYYLLAVVRHWVTIVTGGIIVAVLGIWEHLSGRGVSNEYYACVVLIFIFYSCFSAWRDEFRAHKDLANKAKAKLSLQFHWSGHRPECQDLVFTPAGSTERIEQRLYRIALKNDSTAAITGAQVVLEAVESKHSDLFFPGHGLRVMGQQANSPRFEIDAGATAWIDIIGCARLPSSADFFIPYAEIGECKIPPGQHTLFLRADGGGLPTYAQIIVNCSKEGMLKVIEFDPITDGSGATP